MQIDTQAIDALFAAAIAKPPPGSAGGAAAPAKPAVVNILDMRKGNNIGTFACSRFFPPTLILIFVAIGLSQVKGVTPNQIAQTILLAKDGVLTTEHLEMLAKYIPTSEEVCPNEECLM
jgi:hypothetical protein